MTDTLNLRGHIIGGTWTPVLAEYSRNPTGSIADMQESPDVYHAMIDQHAAAGVSGIVLHIYDADSMTIPGTMLNGTVDLYKIYQGMETPWTWDTATQKALVEHAHANRMSAIVMAECYRGLEMAEKIGADAIKVHMNALIDPEFVEQAACLYLPLFLSTGMATKRQVKNAVEITNVITVPSILMYGAPGLPATAPMTRLDTIPDMRDSFQRLVGFTDNTPGYAASVAAAGFAQAAVIEKLAVASTPNQNSQALGPEGMAELVRCLQAPDISKAFGTVGVQYPGNNTEAMTQLAPRIVVAARNIKSGEELRYGEGSPNADDYDGNIRTIRGPWGHAGGITVTADQPYLNARTARSDIPSGTILLHSHIRPI